MSARAILIASIALMASMGIFGYWGASDMQKAKEARQKQAKQTSTVPTGQDANAQLNQATTDQAAGQDPGAAAADEQYDAQGSETYGNTDGQSYDQPEAGYQPESTEPPATYDSGGSAQPGGEGLVIH